MIAALYVLPDGPYAGRPDVDLWDERRDARTYAGPHPVVAHPPCERWGRYWFGGPSARVRREMGDDGGCFEAALTAVERWGGVLEHPEASSAWRWFGIAAPPHRGGWVLAGLLRPGWTCCVEQGHYGHRARKKTWLYCVTPDGSMPPPLTWGPSVASGKIDDSYRTAEARAAAKASGRHASRTGVGQRLSARQRKISPPAFANLMLSLARAGRGETPTTKGPTVSEPTCDLHNADCVEGMASLPADGVHLCVTSIPFEELFTYSGKVEDVGNNGSTVDIEAGRFALNCRFFAAQLFRVLAPGCVACVHIQQLLAYKNQHGYMGRRDFRGAMYNVFRAAGFVPAGEFVIPKNPQVMAQRLSLHSLQFKTGVERNGTLLAPAVNDYVLIFRKDGEHPCPVRPLYDKRRNPKGWVTTDEWVRDAHGVWTDIQEMDVLQGARDPKHKEKKEEKHVCPLQLEVIRRLVRLYSNPISVQPDVTVLDPFMGIGSTAFVALGGRSPVTKLAVEEPRNVVGFELKESYHRASLGYAAEARKQRAKAAAPDATLFDSPPSPGAGKRKRKVTA